MEYDQSNMFSEIIVKEWWDDDGDDHYDDGAVGKRPVGWSPSHRLPPGFPLPWELVQHDPPAEIVGIHSGLMIQCQNLTGGGVK